jgi:formamidopyrimidine-DNA glycosylase
MFELPELVVLSRQINETLKGKHIQTGCLGNSPHKFVWHNLSHEAFTGLSSGKVIGETHAKGRWLFTELNPGYILLMGEFGGKLLYHPPGSKPLEKYHLQLTFSDGSMLSAMTQMWGAYELYEAGKDRQREYVKGMRVTPVDPEFTLEYFKDLIASLLSGEKRSAKGLLTQDQLIPGLGNSVAQDILFNARIHPRHPLSDMDGEAVAALYAAIRSTIRAVIDQGGRYDELGLFGNPGGYVRLMDSKTAGKPCPNCDTPIEKIQYLGGACYFCPACQV